MSLGGHRDPYKAVMEDIQEDINSIPNKKVVVMGDFNQDIDTIT